MYCPPPGDGAAGLPPRGTCVTRPCAVLSYVSLSMISFLPATGCFPDCGCKGTPFLAFRQTLRRLFFKKMRIFANPDIRRGGHLIIYMPNMPVLYPHETPGTGLLFSPPCCEGFVITGGRKIFLHDQSLEEALATRNHRGAKRTRRLHIIGRFHRP